ncbi:Glycosyl transferase family protein, partial [Lacticaseibacillus paracasei subsp. paracasei Lpp126]
MIPKIIHYVWVGGPKPEWVQKNIDGWRRVLTDYTFQEWNEHNWDISQSQFAKYFYDKKKFGFVGDPIRIDVLNRIGGIYLDTDVEVYKSFDSLLQEKLVFSRIYNNALGTATILAEKNTKMMGDLAQMYDAFSLSDLQSEKVDKVSNGILQDTFLINMSAFFWQYQTTIEKWRAHLTQAIFEVPAMWFETGTFATHHVAGSW